MYRFVGWYLDPDFTTEFTTETVVTSDLVLYARIEEFYKVEEIQTQPIAGIVDSTDEKWMIELEIESAELIVWLHTEGRMEIVDITDSKILTVDRVGQPSEVVTVFYQVTGWST